MKTCKDCYHQKACQSMLETQGYSVSENYIGDATRCDTFKDKSLVLDLPCKVGDTVYRQRKNGQALKKHENVSLEWIVAHLQEFGILVFLTPDDWLKKAEQAKEREKG